MIIQLETQVLQQHHRLKARNQPINPVQASKLSTTEKETMQMAVVKISTILLKKLCSD
jgi:hypothetical protein